MKLIPIHVTLNDDDETTEIIYVEESLSKQEITHEVNEEFGKGGWLAWD